MLEIISGNIIYFSVFILGILCILLGSFLNYRESNRLKKILTATVLECRQVEKSVNGMYLKAYEIDIEICLGTGVVTKTITRGKEMQQWERINVLYNSSKDEVTLLELEKKNASEVPKVLGVFGILVMIIDAIVFFFNSPGLDERTRAHLLGIAMLIPFVAIGLYLCVIIPNKRNKRSYNCELVMGTLADYVRTSAVRLTLWGKKSFTSMPIYEYYYNGEKKKLRGTIGGTSKKYREIGREVTIAVDRENGNAYCLDDEKEIQVIGIIVVICTMAFMLLIASWI